MLREWARQRAEASGAQASSSASRAFLANAWRLLSTTLHRQNAFRMHQAAAQFPGAMLDSATVQVGVHPGGPQSRHLPCAAALEMGDIDPPGLMHIEALQMDVME